MLWTSQNLPTLRESEESLLDPFGALTGDMDPKGARVQSLKRLISIAIRCSLHGVRPPSHRCGVVSLLTHGASTRSRWTHIYVKISLQISND